MKNLLCLLSSILLCIPLAAQDSVLQRLVLIGDAGELVHGLHPVTRAARRAVPFDKHTTVLFLGDNLYRYGLPDEQIPSYRSARAVLDSQASIADGTPAQVYFIPGNHDWQNGGRYGYEAILRQQRYIARLSGRNVHFLPADGCPGPVEVSLGADVTLVLMDSQWWLHPYDKPGIESDCSCKTEADVLLQIDDIVGRNDKKLLLFACHHPFRSNGVHGGYFGLKQHIFPFTDLKKNLYIPLPVIGSIYPISRSVFGSPQDLKHPVYTTMTEEIEELLRKHPYPVSLSGHDHSMQYFADSGLHYVVSGAGCKTGRVEKSRSSKYISDSLGFAVIEVLKNKTVWVKFYAVSPEGAVRMAYADSMLNFSKMPEQVPDTARALPEARFEDSVQVPAGAHYEEASSLQRFFLGENYRKDWAEPVRMQVFKVRTEQGGMKILNKGGGMQTTSLRLEDKKGRQWTLRTVDKDPASVLPRGLKRTFAQAAVQDATSAANPYAPLVIPRLATALRVPHATPRVMFVPNDPALDYYRPLLANKVCLLEEREPVPETVDTRSTGKVLDKVIDDNRHRVDQREVLRARLLDLLIGDWDRHADQWRFGTQDTGKGVLYFAIPRDRDQAMYNGGGLVLRLASRTPSLRFLKPFRGHIPSLEALGYNARFFDPLFLNALSKEDWRRALDTFRMRVPDTIIDRAVQDFPPEIYRRRGRATAEVLKQRRENIAKQGLKYYRFLAREVDVLGSNRRELFLLTGEGRKLRVRMYDAGDTAVALYDRRFDPGITREVRLYGFNDNDRFVVDTSVATPIRLRVIGGRGEDSFRVDGRLKNLLYDFNGEDNVILSRRRTDLRFSGNPRVNSFDPYDRQFSVFRFPALNFAFNPEDGIMAGLGVLKETHGFRKDPYKTYQRFATLYSFTEKAYRLDYTGEFIDLVYGNDLLINGDLHHPTLSNFFGLGNETVRDFSKERSYYRVRYRFISADALLRKRFFANKLGISLGPAYYYYWNRYRNNEDRILADPALVGLDSASVYADKGYLGGRLNITVYNLNNELFPSRGISWKTDLVHYRGLNEAAHPLTRLTSNMQVYASLSEATRLVAVLRMGGGHIFSDNYEYFQALGLGQNNFLRGFRKNRFSGNSMAYGSLELRCRIANVQSYILPGTLGVVGFGDAGRVWARGLPSKKWHAAWGGGLYYIPYQLVIVSATTAFSPEETLFNITIGTRLNFTF